MAASGRMQYDYKQTNKSYHNSHHNSHYNSHYSLHYIRYKYLLWEFYHPTVILAVGRRGVRFLVCHVIDVRLEPY